MITEGINSIHQKNTRRLIFIANELSVRFPDLDLRFNICQETNCIRYKAAAISSDLFEIPLINKSTEDILYEAIFNIKQIAMLYDS